MSRQPVVLRGSSKTGAVKDAWKHRPRPAPCVCGHRKFRHENGRRFCYDCECRRWSAGSG